MLEKIFKQAILRPNKLPRPFLRPLTLPALLLFLNGCAAMAIPPAFSLSSYAVDGFSYLASGKSLTDHAISDAAGRDCATWRIVKRKAICRDFTPKQVAERKRNRREVNNNVDRGYIATSLNGIPKDESIALAARLRKRAKSNSGITAKPQKPVTSRSPIQVHRPIQVRGPLKVKREDLSPAPKPPTAAAITNRTAVVSKREAGKRYVVFGSFRQRGDADRFARRHAAVRPWVVAATVRGQRYYRVVVRPSGDAEMASAMRSLRRAGIRDAYTMRICGPTGGAVHCMRPAAVAKPRVHSVRPGRSAVSGTAGG